MRILPRSAVKLILANDRACYLLTILFIFLQSFSMIYATFYSFSPSNNAFRAGRMVSMQLCNRLLFYLQPDWLITGHTSDMPPASETTTRHM